jgi:hypothetical protein
VRFAACYVVSMPSSKHRTSKNQCNKFTKGLVFGRAGLLRKLSMDWKHIPGNVGYSSGFGLHCCGGYWLWKNDAISNAASI